ncbi:MAG: sorbitol dehydrogenase family protein [Pseudomonas sp.]|uniref:sorbitol dehydrogenase family protein n=1 Tax=Pseudomonas abieticivorans TaxID=2931382 RepID=UPI0020C06537|nr:sorbitol dehydrogenase family protein [Pseudomonas sp. PIA16]MDE1168901.1 sorbitol dehydrogenase family protein [Pseudomonas sp.]
MHTEIADETQGPGLWAKPLKRRAVLLGMAVTAAQLSLPAFADGAVLHDGFDADGFMRVSQVLTGYSELDSLISARIARALIDQQPAMQQSLATLAQLSTEPANVQSAEALLAAADKAGIRDAALAVVSAWFKGTVGHGQSAVLITYQQALMYRPASDGLIVPTYCGNGPLWWTAPIPDASAPASGPRGAV